MLIFINWTHLVKLQHSWGFFSPHNVEIASIKPHIKRLKFINLFTDLK